MSMSSKKSRRQLRRVWQQSNKENLSIEGAQQLTFNEYKQAGDWSPLVQKGRKETTDSVRVYPNHREALVHPADGQRAARRLGEKAT